MKVKNRLLTFCIFAHLLTQNVIAGDSIPLTNNDNLTAAINSNNIELDVLSNDNSGINNDNYKEVVAVCDIATTDMDCVTNTYTDGIATVSINGTGSDNNVLLLSNHTQSHVFEFKYMMQNNAINQSSGLVTVDLSFFSINSLEDNNSDGCLASSCNLREALLAAETDLEPSNIAFDRNINGTISLNSGITINSNDLTINGPGANKISLSGNGQFRVITIPTGTERFSLSGITIKDGLVNNQENGGGILIENALETRLSNIRVVDNTAGNNGGGIYVQNSGLVLINSEISNNLTANNGGGIGIIGGFGSDVTIENSTISQNESTNQTGSGIDINTSFGQTTTLRFITVAFNVRSNGVDSQITGTGNIIIDASVFEPGLAISNDNNVTNNSIFQNISGSIFGQNNRGETGAILNPNLVENNNSGLFGHTIDPDSLAYNHVDDMFGTANCGSLITSDQFGNSRPNEGACDAGAFEYIFIDEIFTSGFE